MGTQNRFPHTRFAEREKKKQNRMQARLKNEKSASLHLCISIALFQFGVALGNHYVNKLQFCSATYFATCSHVTMINCLQPRNSAARLSVAAAFIAFLWPGLEPIRWPAVAKSCRSSCQVLCSPTEVWPLPSTTMLWSTGQGGSAGRPD